jgi:RNA polymerase sigma factor (sigma-70 family)
MNDQLRWQQLQDGQHNALEAIYRDHVEHLLEYGRRFSTDITLVEDAVQDLFVYIWQKRETLSAPNTIRPYLLVALRRRIIRTIQTKQKRQDERPVEEFSFAAEWAVDEQIIAQELSEEQARQLKQAFSNLTGRQREALFLRYYQGLSYEEISDIMDVRYQSLRNLISTALKRLREHMIPLWLIIFMPFY